MPPRRKATIGSPQRFSNRLRGFVAKRQRSKRARSRIYWRVRGGERRAYGDFRDMGGKREALVAPGDERATTDAVIAESLVAKRLSELQEQKRTGVLTGVRRSAKLKAFVADHLIKKAQSGKFSESWLADTERMLGIAIEHFGSERDLASIGTDDVQAWIAILAARSNRRGGKLGGGAIRHHLNVLSNVYRRAQSEGCVTPGYNPCAALIDKPAGKPQEAKWLEVPDAALLLESARTYKPKRADAALPFIYPMIATYLLTGGRETEVLGLEVDDISLERKTVTFRPNRWRRLKSSTSHRTVPLWPQLEQILKDYLKSAIAPPAGGLLFPSPLLDEPGMVTDFRKALDAVAVRAEWKKGDIRSKMFRHTYCAARLQTLDNGAPVSIFTAAKELGHGGEALVRRVYGHLGEVRHRSEVVEFRVKQHRAKLLAKLRHLKIA
jgi:integrase